MFGRRKQMDPDEDLSPRERRQMREMQRRSDYYDDDDEDDAPRKAPLVVRLLAWASVLVIFFALGYGAVSLVFKWMDGRGGERTPSNLAVTQEEARQVVERAREQEPAPVKTSVSCTLFIPSGTTFVSRQIQCQAGIREDTMKQAAAAYMDALKESGQLDASAQNINIFQSGEWVYMNMNAAFLSSLKTMGADRSRYLITGLVRTMSENFSPVNKVKFYIDGREVTDKKPVDLSSAWGI